MDPVAITGSSTILAFEATLGSLFTSVIISFMDIDQPAELPCKDKLAFDTRKEAEATANVAQNRYGSKMHAYVCRYCGLWHLSGNSEAD